MREKNWREFSAAETADFEQPVLISSAFQKLIEEAEPEDAQALRRQVEPSVHEKTACPYETSDPLGEQKYCIRPYLVHQYENRVLLITTGKCLSYCRYCFRRGLTARSQNYIGVEELKEVTAYIENNPQVTEILVSGGDPLSGGFEKLKTVLKSLRAIKNDLLIRLCTRAPIFAPELFTEGLLQLLKEVRPLWLIPHINHPAELGKEQKKALKTCIDSGIPVQSQTVLLKGINDDEKTMVKLFHSLACMGIKPGYLFQLDPAAGTSHFRVPLKEALTLWEKTAPRLSGLSRPQFAADLPEGGGKFPLSALIYSKRIMEQKEGGAFSALGVDNVIHKYTY
ncbi:MULTISPECIES: KamA family radical SAM protein [unclassified Treponema]|uniref:KamA family radical SAM protein n=1 Tax=unclassified Treponema TaxID=2638727 RepID=UPI0020A3ABD3|nr:MULTISPECIES: KamA family radical SAM protein [unclassified Treponema]UTC66985.1 KamA family radical SAM protein [Treponema sp. OMZ 789]UTC69715.1 KamA family radical SAM protein [Treponema sp. OMZ 790]UTC72429.1 KamA family radical SAM protein [Treponema sp. OMZ 791]